MSKKMEGCVMMTKSSRSRSALCHRLILIIIMIIISFLLFSGSEAYKNYTVGDSLGWYDHFQKSSSSSSSSSSSVISYQKWAAGKSFALGDFLIFNTDTNHSVVQTYNFTTYKRCDFEDAETDDTTEWSAGDPSSTTPQQVTVPVPLLKEGINYFFSGDYDGEQCKNGQHFKINVTHGQGLPPSLQQPSSSSSFAPSSSVDPADDNVDSSSFDHPKSAGADDDDTKINKTSTAASGSLSGSCVLLLGFTLGSLVLATC